MGVCPALNKQLSDQIQMLLFFVSVVLVVSLSAAGILVALERDQEQIELAKFSQWEADLRASNVSKALVDQAVRYAIGDDRAPDPDNIQWDYPSSLFFVATVVTTIGYGDSAPRTSGGRAFVVFFGLIGVSLTLFTLNKCARVLLERCDACPCFVPLNDDMPRLDRRRARNKTATLKLALGLIMFVFLMFGGALIFSWTEGWTYLDAVYFSYVTLSTVGLGDFVPTHKSLVQSAIASIYVVVGLVLVAFTVNAVAYKFEAQFELRYELLRARKEQRKASQAGEVSSPGGNLRSPSNALELSKREKLDAMTDQA